MSKTSYLLTFALASVLSSSAWGQPANIAIKAPYAQNLVVATKAAHPELQKLGLHVIPPGERDYFIIANAIPSKIGKKSSTGDLVVINSQKPNVKSVDKDKFFDLGLPVSDTSGRPIGMCVMETPFAFAKDSQDAVAKATIVRDELQQKIASREQLFDQAEPLSLKDSIELPATVKGAFDHFAADPYIIGCLRPRRIVMRYWFSTREPPKPPVALSQSPALMRPGTGGTIEAAK
jgi:hypothetical protein